MFVLLFVVSKQLAKSSLSKKEQNVSLLYLSIEAPLFFKWLHHWTLSETADLVISVVSTLSISPLELAVLQENVI